MRKKVPLRTLLLFVVAFLYLGLSSVESYGEVLSLSVSATRIYQMEGAALRNVKLNLHFYFSGESGCSYCPINHPDWRFGVPYWDHLVYQNLDDPNDKGVAVPLRCIQPSGDDYGTYHYNEELIRCVPLEGSPGWCEESEWDYSWNIYGEVLLTLPWCGNYRIYYVADHREWTRFCNGTMEDSLEMPDFRTVLLNATGIFNACEGIDSNLVRYITTDPNVVHRHTDIFMGECPEHPPLGEASCEFTGYIDSEGGDGRAWLPVPGDSIGLVFEVTTDPPSTDYDVAYHIWDISMWKGECMNSPRYDTCTALDSFDVDPHTLGFAGRVPPDSLWKFRFHDFTLGQPDRFTIYVWDTLTIDRIYPYDSKWTNPFDLTIGSDRRTPVAADTLKQFRTHVIAYHRTDARFDTLWLKSRDYGAHCLVTPQIGGGKDRRMQPWLSPNGENLYTITVPYDYDGPTDVGINYGDGMADAWEDSIDIGDIHRFHPFKELWPNQGIADDDSLPTGRRIDGDGFCNFAEYRGLMVVDDSSKVHTAHMHRRLDPKRKTVIAHVRHNMDDDPENAAVLAQMPGYIYKMQLPTPLNPDTAEIYFTDSIRFRNKKISPFDDEEIEPTRLERVNRDINFNRSAACRWYPGFLRPTTSPMKAQYIYTPADSFRYRMRDDTIRAVTFWKWDENVELDYLRQFNNVDPRGNLGYAADYVAFKTDSSTASIPNYTKRIIINLFAFNYYHERYGGQEAFWQEDFPRLCRKVVAHEFGHTVGMFHTLPSEPQSIMSTSIFNNLLRRFVIADSVYSNSSKSQFSIKRK